MSQPSERDSASPEADLKRVEAKGPWPFLTWQVYQAADRSKHIWSSRHHRKGLTPLEARKPSSLFQSVFGGLWMPASLNWWIGVVFAVGSLAFMIASIFSLEPKLASHWRLDVSGVNAIFFSGSIPFTLAAYMQLFQAANAGEFVSPDPNPNAGVVLLGWRPHDIGWLSSALQFVGTILFNFNTFDAMLPWLNWIQQDLAIWAPNLIGSMLFLASGYLAFIETCHAYWAWKLRSISWWVAFINLLGCLGFMASAVLAVYLPGPEDTGIATLSVMFTLLGATAFLAGSLLTLPEASGLADS